MISKYLRGAGTRSHLFILFLGGKGNAEMVRLFEKENSSNCGFRK